jgi:CBS domain-containing protein
MMEHDLVQLPVTDDGRLIGVLRRTDIGSRLGAARSVVPV